MFISRLPAVLEAGQEYIIMAVLTPTNAQGLPEDLTNAVVIAG